MEVTKSANALLSASKSSDSRVQVQLHPLVILTISDYITRHTLRQQKGPMIGAILGAQHGRDITMEHAFECKLERVNSEEVVIDATWFHMRLQQYKDVHKAPALDLVAWFTVASPDGPQPHHLPVHQQLLTNYNESVLLLLFHPSLVADGKSKGGKLPLTIYESIYEQTASTEDGDKQMSGLGGEVPQLSLRFQELPYTIETGEAEMIGVDFVARGGANATLAEDAKPTTATDSKLSPSKDLKGKGKTKGEQKEKGKSSTVMPTAVSDIILSPEDEDHIASLTARANAIRMLQQRISLIKSYLQSIPPCYLTQTASAPSNNSHVTATPTTQIPSAFQTQVSHPILRQTSALLARLPLLTPSTSLTSEAQTAQTHTHESERLASDVALTSLLGQIGTTISSTQKLGRKAGVFEAARRQQYERELFQRSQGGVEYEYNGGGERGMRSQGGNEYDNAPRGLSAADVNGAGMLTGIGQGQWDGYAGLQEEDWEEEMEE